MQTSYIPIAPYYEQIITENSSFHTDSYLNDHLLLCSYMVIVCYNFYCCLVGINCLRRWDVFLPYVGLFRNKK
jgi:hypothetical protein